MLKTISYNFSSLRSCLRLNVRQDIVNVKSYGTASYPQPKLELPKISLDTEFLLNPDNLEAIRSNIKVNFCNRRQLSIKPYLISLYYNNNLGIMLFL